MTKENVEVVRSSIDAYNRRDIETFAGLVTPDFELFTAIIGPVEGGGSYRGPDGLARYFDAVSEAWAEIRIVAEEFFDLTDTVLVLGRLEGRGRGGGVPVGSPVGAVWDLRGGKIWRLRPYLDHAEAMRAAGLPEEAMSTNVEIVRSLYEAWNRGDTPSALALIDPEIEVEKTQGGFNEGTYRGHAGLSQVLQDFWDQFKFDRSEVNEYIDAHDGVLTAVIHHGRGKGSGIEVEMWHWNLWTLRDGKIVRLQLFLDRAEAMRAAGLVRGAEP